MTLSDLVVGGGLVGVMYGLAALGLSLVWGTLRVINIAHGTIMLLAAYLALDLFVGLRVDPLAAMALTVPLLFILGLVIHRAFIERLAAREEAEMASLLVLFGVMIMIENLITFHWTPDVRALIPAYAKAAWTPAPGFRVPVPALISAGLVFVTAGALSAFLSRTFPGRAVRAVTQNDRMARLCGVNTAAIATLTFGLGSALGAVAGTALVLLYPIYPSVHLVWVLKAFLVAVIGGLGNVWGTIAVGIVIGAAEAVLSAVLPFRWVTVAVYALLLAVLLVRGEGGWTVRRRTRGPLPA